jgi:hypothetical protein
MLDRDGSVLTVTGPVGPSDARLRRSQSLALESGKAVDISRELIFQKLRGQERTVREIAGSASIASEIASVRSLVSAASTIQEIRQLESLAAQAYWSAWHALPIDFPTSDLRRIPEHWRTFGTRKSPLTESPRLAVNPANAMLNYLYAMLESVTRSYERCASCKVAVCTKELIESAHKGRLAEHTAQAEAKRGQSRRRHAANLAAWRPSDQPAWLIKETYVRKIQPRLSNVTIPAIRGAIGVSKSYATNIRSVNCYLILATGNY